MIFHLNILDNHMMNKLTFTVAFGLSLLCSTLSSPINAQVQANEALNAVNTEVEQRAAQLDQKFGVLLTLQERQDMKLALIAKKVATTQAVEAGKSAKQITDEAAATYQIADPAEQRKLLVEVDALMPMSSGIHPPCCGN